MPWTESRVEDRIKFLEGYASGRWTVSELCRSFGISRKTAYKFIGRFEHEGVSGLLDRSRAPHRQPGRTPEAVERRIVAAARKWRYWGPRKLRAILQRRHPDIAWPAKSTFGDILKRHGLVTPRRRHRRRVAVPRVRLATAEGPNDIWATDFKGWRLSGDRSRCEPFVLNDLYSRFCTTCRLVRKPDTESVWPHFKRAFREYGLPRVMRSDNGPPFATHGLASLSRLTVRFLRLGIRPERIEPGKPYQNGCLERFNLTVELEAMRPRPDTWGQQDRLLRQFQKRFNELRPHEALHDRTPVEVYQPSPRSFPNAVPEFEYSDHIIVRRVRSKGQVKWRGQELFVSEAVAGEQVGFEQISDRHWSIRLGPVELAILDDETLGMLRHDLLVWVEPHDAEPR